MEIPDAQVLINKIRDNIAKVMIGKQDTLDLLLIALISHGHVLLEDIPGIGKTTLVSSLAKSLGLSRSGASSSHQMSCHPISPVSISTTRKPRNLSFTPAPS